MKNRINKFVLTLVIAFLFLMPQLGGIEGVQAQEPILPVLQPYLSADGLTLYNGVPPLIVIADPNLAMQGIQVPASPEIQAAMADPEAANATFSITYVAAGGQDLWGAVCQTFPDQAKTAFNAAAAIWASTIQSSVPITISACWSNLGSSSILGYSGGEPLHRNFTGAPKSNTWYEGSLANALHGSDLDAAHFDDYITYNSNFTWYYGTDGHPTSGTYDLVTVAAHEIAHGLNFAGMADYSGGVGSYDYLGYPSIYDTFMEDGSGTKLTSYTNNSTSLGSLLTSGNLWFNGTNANAANGGSRVRIYAPSSWSSGSSYSHLDYSTFAGTINSMMVYAVASGASQHNPGPVTKGIFKDMGWTLVEAPVSAPAAFNKSAPANTSTQFSNATLSWQSSTGATSYYYCIDTNPGTTCDTSWVTTNASTSVSLSGLSLGTHYWQVYAHNSIGDTYANSGTWWSFTVISAQKIYLPLIIKSPPPPGSFGKSSPTNGATGQSTSPTLSWGTSSGATSYEYCIDTNSSHANNSCGSTWKSSTTPVSGLSPSTTYYWQVRANNTGGSTYADGLTWWSFTTGSGSSIPLANGDFESGATVWTEYSAWDAQIILSSDHLPIIPHGGNYAAWLGGLNDEIAYIQQQVTIPSSAPYLVYWHWIGSTDLCGYDFGGVIINNSVVHQYDLCGSTATGGWVKHSVNLSSYAGQSVSLQIRVETDSSAWSNLFVDDVSFQSSPGVVTGDVSGPPSLNPKTVTGKSEILASRMGLKGNDHIRLFGPK
jgi:hypothetical protein